MAKKVNADNDVLEKNHAARAVQFIEERIRAGIYLPGERLVEADAAAASGLGIAPVREAIRFLAGEGVLDLVPYRGASIKRLKPRDMLHIMQVVEGLGSVGVKLAVRATLGPAELKSLRESVKTMQDAANEHSTIRLVHEASEYHRKLIEFVGNSYLAAAWDRMHLDLFHRELSVFLVIHDWDGYVKVYRSLTQTIEQRDEKKALDIIQRHAAWLLASLRPE
jgi:DNA-binding GntR family transcriptional regulator